MSVRLANDAAAYTQWIALMAPPGAPISDGDGGFIESPQPLTPPNDWAAIEPATVNSDELPMAGTAVVSITHRVRLRYRPDIDTRTQITFTDWGQRAHHLYVRALQNLKQQSDVLQLWCEEQTT